MKKFIFVSLLVPLLVSCGSVSPSQSQPAPKAFDSKRTQYTCTTWTPPSPPDAESHLWYRAATLIHAEGWRKNTRQAQDMITLYEAAASKGHYQAINNLYLLYTNGHGASGTLYAPQPSRARKWLHYGLDKNWAMANY